MTDAELQQLKADVNDVETKLRYTPMEESTRLQIITNLMLVRACLLLVKIDRTQGQTMEEECTETPKTNMRKTRKHLNE